MDWEKPHVTVIDMNAEIGAYQADLAEDAIRVTHASEKPEHQREPMLVQTPSDE